MITLPLRLRYAEMPLRPPAAWLIPGSDPRAWLDEMLAWGVPLDEAALYAIPRSAHDQSPQGVLVVLPPGLAPQVTHRSQPYAALVANHAYHAERDTIQGRTKSASPVVYLPINALIEPAASDLEVAAAATDDGDCILHPILGRVRLERGDRRHVIDLLTPPVERPARWDLAEPGQHVNARLTAIVPAETLSLDEMLDEGRDDIGSQSPTLDDLPPEPNEPSSSLIGKLCRGLQRKLAQMMRKLAEAGGAGDPPAQGGAAQSGAGQGSAAGRPGKPGMFSQMANWARQKIAALDDSLRKSRHRELHRLMHLLQNDPDQGLRFALPCGEGKNRGLAPPSGKLASRNVDFNIRRLGGGGPADPWQLPGDLYSQLRAKYMELAGREMRLGRYRRAAYIYAHLLGDFTNAASALAAGKHWREAAALYRDRLKRPETAAMCLEQGGLWAEAIAFYEELGHYEKVGDLYSNLEQPAEAEKAWRRAVEKHRADRDLISAARLLETKLKAPDEALEILAAAWPDSSQAGACLAEQFALLARLGRHDAAHRRVDEIRQENLDASIRMRVIDVLVENATRYPHDTVRHTAADATRTIVALHLRQTSGYELNHLLESIRRLAPADRLLERDTARYMRNATQPPPRPSAKPGRAAIQQSGRMPEFELKRLEPFTLRGGVKWQSAVSCGDHFYAAGFRDREVLLSQCSWTGFKQDGIVGMSDPRGQLLLACDPHGQHEVLIEVINGSPLRGTIFVSSDAIPYEVQTGAIDFFAAKPVAYQKAANGLHHTLDMVDDGMALITHDPNRAPNNSQLITYESLWSAEGVSGTVVQPVLPVPICAREAGVYLGLGDRLVLVSPGKTQEVFTLPGGIRSLCGSTPYSVSRIVAALEQGAALFWEEEQRAVLFAEGLRQPVAAVTLSGLIVLASCDELQVYKTWGRKIQLALQQRREGRPIALLCTEHPDGFAVVCEDGVVEQFQMLRRH